MKQQEESQNRILKPFNDYIKKTFFHFYIYLDRPIGLIGNYKK
jgi:hypothetical protein